MRGRQRRVRTFQSGRRADRRHGFASRADRFPGGEAGRKIYEKTGAFLVPAFSGRGQRQLLSAVFPVSLGCARRQCHGAQRGPAHRLHFGVSAGTGAGLCCHHPQKPGQRIPRGHRSGDGCPAQAVLSQSFIHRCHAGKKPLHSGRAQS